MPATPADVFLLSTDYRLLHFAPLDGEAGVLPSGHAADEGGRVRDAFRLEYARRTGARLFGRSSAVEDERLVARHLGGARLGLVLRQGERAPDVLLLVGGLRARVVDGDAPLLDHLLQLRDADAADVVGVNRGRPRGRGRAAAVVVLRGGTR